MADIERMLRAIQKFEFASRPTNANDSAPCTVGDLNRLIDNLSKVLKTIVSESEK